MNLLKESSSSKLEAFMNQRIDSDNLTDETWAELIMQADKATRFKEISTSGATSCLLDMITKCRDDDDMRVLIMLRFTVGFSLGFQYAQALYEQKELEKL